jgi:hypothetical protein
MAIVNDVRINFNQFRPKKTRISIIQQDERKNGGMAHYDELVFEDYNPEDIKYRFGNYEL